MCWSCGLICNCIGAERGDYTWNAKLFCNLYVDSIRSLLVSLNAIKRTPVVIDRIQQPLPKFGPSDLESDVPVPVQTVGNTKGILGQESINILEHPLINI